MGTFELSAGLQLPAVRDPSDAKAKQKPKTEAADFSPVGAAVPFAHWCASLLNEHSPVYSSISYCPAANQPVLTSSLYSGSSSYTLTLIRMNLLWLNRVKMQIRTNLNIQHPSFLVSTYLLLDFSMQDYISVYYQIDSIECPTCLIQISISLFWNFLVKMDKMLKCWEFIHPKHHVLFINFLSIFFYQIFINLFINQTILAVL